MPDSADDLLRALPASPAALAQAATRRLWRPARHLQTLDAALVKAIRGAGRLVVAMPPRHGKSELCSKYLPAWFLGAFPDKRVLLACYAAELARRWGRQAREVIAEHGWLLGIRLAKDSRAAHRWDLAGRRGGMITVGVGGSLTGQGADLLVIDDPIKNSQEVRRDKRRQDLWDWWETTARTRLEPGGAVVVIQTRWHEDDLVGRLLRHSAAGGEPWEELSLPALALERDAVHRQPSGLLWPERWSLAELQERHRSLGATAWSALYQQRPVAPGGQMFQRRDVQIVPAPPPDAWRAVRYWDKAASAGDGDYTVGVLMVEHAQSYFVVDVIRGQWSVYERENRIAAAAERDRLRFPRTKIHLEQEPGSAGKESAEATGRRLAGYAVKAERSTGSKEVRADPLASVAAFHALYLVSGPWNDAFVDELVSFPHGPHDDQVDAAAGAFNALRNVKKFAVSVSG